MKKSKMHGFRSAYFELRKSTKAQLAAARNKWARACLPLIRKARTVKEAEAAFRATPSGTPAKELALKRWAELCADPNELLHAYQVSSRRFRFDNPAMTIWRDRSRVEVDAAQTIDEAEQALFRTPGWDWDNCDSLEGRELARDHALEKLYSLCTTIEQLQHYEKRHVRDHGTPGKSKQIYEARFLAISSAQPTG